MVLGIEVVFSLGCGLRQDERCEKCEGPHV
jgi:hypothetical protein